MNSGNYPDPRFQQPRQQTPPPGYYTPRPQWTPSPVTSNQYYGQPPQPQRSGCRSTLTRRVSVPLWLVIVSILITVGSCTSFMANQQSTQGTASTVNTPDTSNSQPQTLVTSNPTPAPTPVPTIKPTPTHTPKLTTIQSFSGNGTKKTPVFTVPDNWQLVWSCDPSSFGGSYNVIVAVVGADGSQIDPTAVNTLCQSGNTGDQTQEYQGGTVYLDVQSEAAWTIKVKALE